MIYQKFGKTDLNVSRVALGTWALGSDFFGTVEEERGIATVHAAIDSGINFIDTAPNYGNSESIVGKAIYDRRDKVILATKCGNFKYRDIYYKLLTPKSMRYQLEDSLRLMQTDYIDLYQIHWPDKNSSMEAALNELVKMRDEGKIRYFGVCNHTPDELKVAVEAGAVSVQMQYSLMKRDIEKDMLKLSVEYGLGSMVYGTLVGGLLTGKFKEPKTEEKIDRRPLFYKAFNPENWEYSQKILKVIEEVANANNQSMANVAIKWALQHEGVTTTLIGASKPEQAVENATAADWILPESDMEKLNAITN